jgi:hypothetical protein
MHQAMHGIADDTPDEFGVDVFVQVWPPMGGQPASEVVPPYQAGDVISDVAVLDGGDPLGPIVRAKMAEQRLGEAIFRCEK